MAEDTTLLDRVKLLLADPVTDAQDALLTALLQDAADMICAFTWRQSVPACLLNIQARMAVILYNTRGSEGERARQEGDIRRDFDAMPDDIRRALLCCRVGQA